MIRLLIACLWATLVFGCSSVKGSFKDGIYVAPDRSFSVRFPVDVGSDGKVSDRVREYGLEVLAWTPHSLQSLVRLHGADTRAGMTRDERRLSIEQDGSLRLIPTFRRAFPGAKILSQEYYNDIQSGAWVYCNYVPPASSNVVAADGNHERIAMMVFLVCWHRGNHAFMASLTEAAASRMTGRELETRMRQHAIEFARSVKYGEH